MKTASISLALALSALSCATNSDFVLEEDFSEYDVDTVALVTQFDELQSYPWSANYKFNSNQVIVIELTERPTGALYPAFLSNDTLVGRFPLHTGDQRFRGTFFGTAPEGDMSIVFVNEDWSQVFDAKPVGTPEPKRNGEGEYLLIKLKVESASLQPLPAVDARGPVDPNTGFETYPGYDETPEDSFGEAPGALDFDEFDGADPGALDFPSLEPAPRSVLEPSRNIDPILAPPAGARAPQDRPRHSFEVPPGPVLAPPAQTGRPQIQGAPPRQNNPFQGEFSERRAPAGFPSSPQPPQTQRQQQEPIPDNRPSLRPGYANVTFSIENTIGGEIYLAFLTPEGSLLVSNSPLETNGPTTVSTEVPALSRPVFTNDTLTKYWFPSYSARKRLNGDAWHPLAGAEHSMTVPKLLSEQTYYLRAIVSDQTEFDPSRQQQQRRRQQGPIQQGPIQQGPIQQGPIQQGPIQQGPYQQQRPFHPQQPCQTGFDRSPRLPQRQTCPDQQRQYQIEQQRQQQIEQQRRYQQQQQYQQQQRQQQYPQQQRFPQQQYQQQQRFPQNSVGR